MQKFHVIVQTAFVGDLFLNIPTMNRLKQYYPNDKIILICKKGLSEFFVKHGLVDQAFEVDKHQRHTYNEIVKKINKLDIENIFCFHQSIRSALFCYKIKSKNKFSFSQNRYLKLDWKKIIFHRLVKYNKSWPDVIRQMSLLTVIDSVLLDHINSKDWTYLNHKNENNQFSEIPQIFKFPVLKNNQKNNQENNQENNQTILVDEKHKMKKIALFPGSVWATKKWTTQGFSNLAQKLIQHGFEVTLMGSPSDQLDSQAIILKVPQIKNLTGQFSLYESVQVLNNYDLIICNDSAPAHMAAALNKPVVSIFGPTSLEFGFRPWVDLCQAIEVNNLKCRPCGPHGHVKCPLSHHDCMNKIDDHQVYQAALELIESTTTKIR